MQINILGAGVMARQIAALLSLGDFEVQIWSHNGVNEKQLNLQRKVIARKLGLSSDNKISIHETLESLPDALTIECISENLQLKQQLYQQYQKHFSSAYFSNTSSYSPSEIGEDVKGLHFFNPIDMRLVELSIQDNEPQKQALKPLLSFLEENNFVIVNVLSNRGYIGNYILFREISNFFKLYEAYSYPLSELEKIYHSLYGGRDLIAIVDIVGIDITLQIIENLNVEDRSFYVPEILREAISQNILGRKNKRSIKELMTLD